MIHKDQLFTPAIRIGILLTVGILTARYLHFPWSTLAWLIAILLSFGVAIYYRQHISQQCLALYLCIICIGGALTSHAIDKSLDSYHIESYEDLSALDRTLLKANEWRNQIESKMREMQISDQDYAVITAMALGDKTALDAETKDAYSIAGTSHVLAVSGLHIGIIFQLFILLLGGRKKSILTICLSTIAIWSYVVLIGMPASAVRSATMISIYSFAILAQKDALSVNNLAVAYIIMLFISPLYLFDISFQMSFLAVLSILVFFPSISSVFHFSHTWSRWIWNLLCLSIAAQIGTIPLVAFYFGRISCYSLLTSFIAIPSATFILYLCAILFLLSPIVWLFSLSWLSWFAWLGTFASTLQHLAVRCLVSITQFDNTIFRLTTMLPGASIENIHLSLLELLLIYLTIILIFLLVRMVMIPKGRIRLR